MSSRSVLPAPYHSTGIDGMAPCIANKFLNEETAIIQYNQAMVGMNADMQFQLGGV